MGNSSDRVSRFYHHDSGSGFSRKMAIVVVHGNTVPDGARVALGHRDHPVRGCSVWLVFPDSVNPRSSPLLGLCVK